MGVYGIYIVYIWVNRLLLIVSLCVQLPYGPAFGGVQNASVSVPMATTCTLTCSQAYVPFYQNCLMMDPAASNGVANAMNYACTSNVVTPQSICANFEMRDMV